jgi:hypothetical protein
MKQTILALVFFLVCIPRESTAQWLFTQNAIFISVIGQVTVKDNKGLIREGEKDSEAYLGETVLVGKDSQATLRFFDGSTVEIKPNTEFMIVSLKHPTDKQKEIRFTLISGWVLAKVQKLKTASSLFEIEAGGVICGVRGTQFSVVYEPTQERVDLKVTQGRVYAKADGKTNFLNAVEEMEFNHGRLNSHLNQDRKSAIKDIQEKVPDFKVAEALPLALEDLNAQFMGEILLNGKGFSTNSALGGTLQSSTNLANVGSLLPVNGIYLKLPKLP